MMDDETMGVFDLSDQDIEWNAYLRSVMARVEKGGAWLDEHRPDWLDIIQPQMLDLENKHWCVLGQLAQHVGIDFEYLHLVTPVCDPTEVEPDPCVLDFMSMDHRLSEVDALHMGFNTTDEGDRRFDQPPWGAEQYGYLDDAWQAYITGRLG